MRKVLLCLAAVLCIAVVWSNNSFAEGAPVEKAAEAAGAAGASPESGGTFGAVSVDGKMYYMLGFFFDLPIGELGFGFNVRLLWNDDGIKEDDWNNWQNSISNMFRYVRWAHKGDPVYIKLGVIDAATLGHGFIVRRYCNVGSDIYNRKFGTEFDVNMGEFGVETVTNDVMWERFYGGRLYLSIIKDMLSVGATAAYDANPAKDKLVGGLPAPDAATLAVYGADIGLSLIKTDVLSLLVYCDWAKIRDYGQGFVVPGFMGKLLFFDYQVEFRMTESNFIGAIFDYQYEDLRPFDLSLYPVGGEMMKGVFGEIGANLFGYVRALGAVVKMQGSNPDIRGEVVYTGNVIPKVSEAAVGIEQKNVEMLNIKDPTAVAYARVGLDMSPGVTFMLTIKQTYDAPTDKFKRTTIMAMQLKF